MLERIETGIRVGFKIEIMVIIWDIFMLVIGS